jgi:uncharacterized membrane protein YhaH (DUF805 family)
VQYGYVQYDAPTISVPPIPGVEPPLNRPYYGIGFGKAFKRAFRKYATFSGRASPSEYWWFQLVNILVVTVAFACFAVFGGLGFYGWAGTAHSYGTPDAVWMMAWLLPPGLLFLWGLATFIPNLALVWRRLHDSGHSGAWYLLPFLALPILELSVRYVTFGVGSRLFRLLNMAVSVTILVFLIQGPSPKGVRWDR